MLGQGRLIKSFVTLALFATAFAGCSSNKKKYELRDKVALSSGLFCDFVNGDKHKEVELELNVAMARKCDPEKPYSITGYRNASEVHGMMFCCSMRKLGSSSDKNENSTKAQSSAKPAAQTPATRPASTKSSTKPAATEQKDSKDAKDDKDDSEAIAPL